jgi:Cell Wall Hydrolase
VISNDEKDLMARTITAENQQGSPDEQSAIAHVMLNRLNGGKYGNTMRGVLLAPKQFSPFNPGSNNSPYDVNSASPVYKSALDAVNKAAGGQEDPTNGAMFYANPDRVKGKQPAFMKLPAQKIGAHTFYGGQQQAANDDEINSIVKEHYPAAGGGGSQSPRDDDVNAIVSEHYPPAVTPNERVQQGFSIAAGSPLVATGTVPVKSDLISNFIADHPYLSTAAAATAIPLMIGGGTAAAGVGGLARGGMWLGGKALQYGWPIATGALGTYLGMQEGKDAAHDATGGLGTTLLDLIRAGH